MYTLFLQSPYREGTFVVGEAAGLAGLLNNPRGTILLNSIMREIALDLEKLRIMSKVIQ